MHALMLTSIRIVLFRETCRHLKMAGPIEQVRGPILESRTDKSGDKEKPIQHILNSVVDRKISILISYLTQSNVKQNKGNC